MTQMWTGKVGTIAHDQPSILVKWKPDWLFRHDDSHQLDSLKLHSACQRMAELNVLSKLTNVKHRKPKDPKFVDDHCYL